MISTNSNNSLNNIISMPSQTTDYTCGPCSLMSYSKILGRNLNFTELELADQLNCIPNEGTQLNELAKYSLKNLDAISYGENTWDGKQMMIAIITERALDDKNFTHAVCVLGRDFLGSVVWWCSWLNEVKKLSLHEFNWISTDSKYKKWSINFPTTFDSYKVGEIADKLRPSNPSFYQKKLVNNIIAPFQVV